MFLSIAAATSYSPRRGVRDAAGVHTGHGRCIAGSAARLSGICKILRDIGLPDFVMKPPRYEPVFEIAQNQGPSIVSVKPVVNAR